jgi:hypothetical protein
MKLPLDVVTYMVVYLCRGDQIIRGRANSAREPGCPVVERKNPFLRGPGRPYLALWSLAAAGLSLSAPGASKPRPLAGSCGQNGVHGQTALRLSGANPATSSAEPTNDQPGRRRGVASLFVARKKAWLTPHAIAYGIANFNTARIVSPPKSWCWFIGFWCRTAILGPSLRRGTRQPQ